MAISNPPILSGRKSKIVVAFACIVLATSILAIKFSAHPAIWLLGIAASVPVFAAIVGAIQERN
jgi:hypothetical protein